MKHRHPSSFRDPSGFVFSTPDGLMRQVNPIYFREYQALKSTGFFQQLFDKKMLIPHIEVSGSADAIVLKPEQIPFISYPYEWSFLQYKHAALLTLKIQKLCLENGFSLKDATAFNVTFHEGRAIFLDTLSPEFYQESQPWHAYGQFIAHFLGPLVLCHYYGLEYLKSLSADIDGIPLERLSRLLPFKSRLNPIVMANIHLPAKYFKKYSNQDSRKSSGGLSKNSQLKLIDSLSDYITGLKVKEATEWDNYYHEHNYKGDSLSEKKKAVTEWGASFSGKKVLDVGGNDGTFSRLIPEAALIITADIDPNAVSQNYRLNISNKEKNILPLVADFLNPAAGIGFNNSERESLLKRLKMLELDGCMALAVIHHISLSGNIPFELSAGLFANLAPELLIEFPTREDSWVQFLLKGKREFQSHFDWYNEIEFEKAYSEKFDLVSKNSIEGASRLLYSFKRKPHGEITR